MLRLISNKRHDPMPVPISIARLCELLKYPCRMPYSRTGSGYGRFVLGVSGYASTGFSVRIQYMRSTLCILSPNRIEQYIYWRPLLSTDRGNAADYFAMAQHCVFDCVRCCDVCICMPYDAYVNILLRPRERESERILETIQFPALHI